MPCSGSYGTVAQYANFWCRDTVVTGINQTPGVGVATLTDSGVNFEQEGAEPNCGMMLYNLTTLASGQIIAVSGSTLQATGVTWTLADAYRAVLLKRAEQSLIEQHLAQTATHIHAARAARAQCDCTLASWAADYLAQLNVLLSGVYHTCPCINPTMAADDREMLLNAAVTALENIRTGKTPLCEGDTGSEYPVADWIEMSLTDFAAARISLNQLLRTIP